MRHVLNLFEVTSDQIRKLFVESAHLKAAHARRIHTPMLLGKVVAMVFEKPSLRTRVSFEAAIAQLGGTSIFMGGKEVGLGSRESVPDVSRTISQYVDAVVLRTYSHQTIEDFANYSSCPVINGLSDLYHPCQALADIFTIQEIFGEIREKTIAFIGDGNNVARSLAIGSVKLGLHFILAAPPRYHFENDFVQKCEKAAEGGTITQVSDAGEAVKKADILYTDVWTSMGQEAEQAERMASFAPFQINANLLTQAPSHARVMHCLPARRGEEITSDVLDGKQSVVFQQAGNRMHAQKALLVSLLS